MYDNNIHRAIEFAASAHSRQYRKGTETPYIAHPFEVAQMLTAYGCRENLIIAGLLHDVLEDTLITKDIIINEFGAEVAQFVEDCTENKSKSWQERKQHTINFLSRCDNLEMLVLSCADKTANLRSIKSDYDKIGEVIWNRFKAGRDESQWYYRHLNEIFKILDGHDVYLENTELYEYIFQNGNSKL